MKTLDRMIKILVVLLLALTGFFAYTLYHDGQERLSGKYIHRVPAEERLRTVYGTSQKFVGIPRERTIIGGNGIGSLKNPPSDTLNYEPNSETYSGYYNTSHGFIRLNDNLQTPKNILHVLSHEYGHAFLYDCITHRDKKENLKDDIFGSLLFSMLSSTTRESLSAGFFMYPKTLEPVLNEYQEKIPADIYGNGYYTDNFGEYMAESYSRIICGEEVPTNTKIFFLSFTN